MTIVWDRLQAGLKAIKLARRELVIVQVHGPLFLQFRQIASAARLATRSERKLAVDNSLYDVFGMSSDVAPFLSPQLVRTTIDLELRRPGANRLRGRSDWRRALRSCFSPISFSYSDLPAVLPAGSWVLQGFPACFDEPLPVDRDGTVFRNRVEVTAGLTGSATFSGTAFHDTRVSLCVGGLNWSVRLFGKELAEPFARLLHCSTITTNDPECAHWIRILSDAEVTLVDER